MILVDPKEVGKGAVTVNDRRIGNKRRYRTVLGNKSALAVDSFCFTCIWCRYVPAGRGDKGLINSDISLVVLHDEICTHCSQVPYCQYFLHSSLFGRSPPELLLACPLLAMTPEEGTGQ